jgi:hypothetical protein
MRPPFHPAHAMVAFAVVWVAVVLSARVYTRADASALTPSQLRRPLQHGVYVGPGSPCSVDSDCFLAKAVCWPLAGNAVQQGHCACDFGLVWHAQNATCRNQTDVTGHTVVEVDRTTRLAAFADAPEAPRLWWAENYGQPALWREAQPAPAVWTCAAEARICWAEENGAQFVSVVPQDWWQIRYKYQVTKIRLADVFWRCAPSEETPKRFRRLLDNGASTSYKGRAMRPPHEHCGECDRSYCSGRGTCAGDFVCTCDHPLLWEGARCEVPTASSVLAARALLHTTTTCTSDDLCETLGEGLACWQIEGDARAQGRCLCKEGYDAASASEVAGGQLSCTRSARTHTLVGGSVSSTTVADVHLSVDRPTRVWWETETTRHVADLLEPVDTNATQWSLATPARHAWKCLDPATFFVDTTRPNDPDAHCLGARAVCGQGVDVQLSHAASGSCICTSHFMNVGNRCHTCRAPWTGPFCMHSTGSCGHEYCHGNGVCASGSRASTVLRARVRADTANDERIGMSAGLPGYCVCGDTNTPRECTNTTTCASLVYGLDNSIALVVCGGCAPRPVSYGLMERSYTAERPVCLCTRGAGGADCVESSAECAARVCGAHGGHGTCVQTELGDECACLRVDGELQWFGAHCNVSSQACRTSRCSGHGTCLTQQQGCKCDPFWTGYACEQHTCAHDGTPSDEVEGTCTCGTNFTGNHCERWKCNQDSAFNVSSGACECGGLWTLDPNSLNCTLHTCGAGAPALGAPHLCACEVGASAHSSAPHCRRACRFQNQTHGTDGECRCPAGYQGRTCATVFSSSAQPLPHPTNTLTTLPRNVSLFHDVVIGAPVAVHILGTFAGLIKTGLQSGFLSGLV